MIFEKIIGMMSGFICQVMETKWMTKYMNQVKRNEIYKDRFACMMEQLELKYENELRKKIELNLSISEIREMIDKTSPCYTSPMLLWGEKPEEQSFKAEPVKKELFVL